MTRTQFEAELRRAQYLCRGSDKPRYWEGYQLGLRRAFYRELFGTLSDHEHLMALVDSPDAAAREKGQGYRDAYALA